MLIEADKFEFVAPRQLSWARRVLIKPCAGYPAAYPVTTDPKILSVIVEGIRKVSDADILIADGTPTGESIYPVYKKLGYDFPHVLMLDVKDSIFVEVENPLPQFLAVPTFWIPNIVLRSDFLISVTPFKVGRNAGWLSIANLLSLLPVDRYQKDDSGGWGALYELGIEKVLADLYFTIPFDVGIIEAAKRFSFTDNPVEGQESKEERADVFYGEPYEVDKEVSQRFGLEKGYLELIGSEGVPAGG
jgi:uncharacterized protein (DUF362 family)